VDASQRIDFSMDLTQGDVVGDYTQNPVVDYPTAFSNAVINVPEPSTALLFSLGLVGIALGRRGPR
jgi:hypothetical protein